MHFRTETLQSRYEMRGTTCPADLCDIFECPELPERLLKDQVYNERANNEDKI